MENDQFQPTPQTPTSEVIILGARQDELQKLFLYMLVVLCVLAGTLCLFLSRQSKNSASDLALYRTQTTNLVAQLKPNEPMMDDLVRKFQDFGRANPDFVPLLTKYGIPVTPAGATPVNRAPTPSTPKK